MINAKNFIRNVNFTTNSVNYELLTDTNIANAIKERLGFDSVNEVAKYIEENNLNIYFEIYFTAPQAVSINGSQYYPTMTGDLYYSGEFVNPVNSIKVQNSGASGMIAFQIK